MEEKKILSTHSLMLENRQNGRITGVKDIKSFDEKEILLFTGRKLVIKGRTASCEAA
ncbi:MAG: YabP/YqfC family sporulation protein [Blautia obeum]